MLDVWHEDSQGSRISIGSNATNDGDVWLERLDFRLEAFGVLE